jgi:PAS domain-containing protein
MPKQRKRSGPAIQLDQLRSQVAELEETLRAIRMGEVDAVLISDPEGKRVFTLQGTEHPYRVMVETFDEGAATLAADGAVLYANRSFAKIFDVPLEKLIGSRLNRFVFGDDQALLVAYFFQQYPSPGSRCNSFDVLACRTSISKGIFTTCFISPF